MRGPAWVGAMFMCCATALVGCGGTSVAGVENEIETLKAEAPNIKDEAAFKAFNQKAEAIAAKIKSLPTENQPELSRKLGMAFLEATVRGFKGGVPGFPGGFPGMPSGMPGVKIEAPGVKIDIGPK